MSLVLSSFGILLILGFLLFSEPGLAAIDWFVRKWLAKRGRHEDLKKWEAKEPLPRFRVAAKSDFERKAQSALLVVAIVSAGAILTYFYTNGVFAE